MTLSEADLERALGALLETALSSPAASTEHRDAVGESEPDHVVENFWDLAEILAEKYQVAIPEVL